jgi:hypothetical protein
MVYVSITGLKLKSLVHAPAFWWHAIRSMRQAQSAPGLISAEARLIKGIHHTLTVWETEAAMRAYLISGAHLAAMKAFHGIATGRTVGFLTEAAPDWEAVHEIWEHRGNAVQPG